MTPDSLSQTAPDSDAPVVLTLQASAYALLGLLADGARHGYDLTHAFAPDTELGQVVRLEMAMLYNVLRRLEGAGLIAGKDEPLSANRSRRLFHLTDEGRGMFERWLTTPVTKTRDMRLDFLAKLYFVRQRGTAEVARLIDAQLATSRAVLVRLDAERQTALLTRQLPPDNFERIVLDLRVEQNMGVVLWLERCRALLVGHTS